MKIAIVGVGLIGSSFALAARDIGLFRHFVGIDPSKEACEHAKKLGIIDDSVESIPLDCEAIMLASPCDTIPGLIAELADHPGILFDVGSVKGGIINSVLDSMEEMPSRYVPCHPIVGGELSGPGAARMDLFADKMVIISPSRELDAGALRAVEHWWKSLGAEVKYLEADLHDEIYSLTSHLPHAIVFAYLQRIKSSHLDHVGGGFRDFSRIGGSDSAIWASIFEHNKKPLLSDLDRFINDLEKLKSLINSGTSEQIKDFINSAKAIRNQYD